MEGEGGKGRTSEAVTDKGKFWRQQKEREKEKLYNNNMDMGYNMAHFWAEFLFKEKKEKKKGNILINFFFSLSVCP